MIINKRICCVFGLALGLQLFFFAETFFNKGTNVMFSLHGLASAYNIAVYTTPHIKENIITEGFSVSGTGDIRVPPLTYPIIDTMGYSVLLGILWKVTNSFSLYDIIFLQIVLFAFVIAFFDQALLLLLKNKCFALSGTLGLLFFLPIQFFNVQPVKDIYLFYGIILCFIAVAHYFFGAGRYWHLCLLATLFALCQWIRSPLFGTLCMMTLMLIIWFRLFSKDIKKVLLFLLSFWGINILIFWVPFLYFNKVNHSRYFASCSGQALIGGIGEFKNKWGFELGDPWFIPYIEQQEPSLSGKYGTVAFDDVAKRIALNICKDDPYYFLKNSIKRIPQVIYQRLSPYSFLIDYPGLSNRAVPLLERLLCTFQDLGVVRSLLFAIQKLYALFFIIIGHIGLVFLFKKREYALLALWISLYIGSVAIIVSHIELRYVYPVICLWGIFTGIISYQAYLFMRQKLQ